MKYRKYLRIKKEGREDLVRLRELKELRSSLASSLEKLYRSEEYPDVNLDTIKEDVENGIRCLEKAVEIYHEKVAHLSSA